MKVRFSEIILFLVVIGIVLVIFYPKITGVALLEQFEPTAEEREPIFEGGGYDLYLSEIKKIDNTTWSLDVQGKVTRWIKIIDRSLNIEAQVWDCPDEEYSVVYKSSNTIKADGLFTIKASFTTPESGKVRILFHNTGSTIDSGYNLKTGSLIKDWNSKLLKGIRDAKVCS